jgi:hypothetical protein
LTTGIWKFHVKAEDNASNQSIENSSLLAVLSSSIREVTVDCSVPLVQVITPSNIVNPVLDLSPITDPDGKLLVANITCNIHLETLLPSAIVTVDIPAQAAIKGPSALWSNKVIIPPVPITPPADLLPSGSQISLAIEVGHQVAPLDITRGTRIFMNNQAGKNIGYISNNVFREITNACSDDSQIVGDALATGQDCKIENGSDLVIWTKHFSSFITYDLASSSTDSTSGETSTVDTTILPETGTD